jgi:hypothetical protein
VSITRLVLYAVLGTLLGVLGHDYTTVEFWLFVALYWAIERTANIELIEQLQEELQALRRKHGIEAPTKDTPND